MSVGHKSVIGLWVSACAAVGVVVPQAFGQAAPTGTTAKPASAANKAKSVQALLQQGIDALSAGQYQPAREAFQDAATLDPRNPKAFHGLALCMMAQKEIAKAGLMFDKGLAVTTAPDRAMVLNAAACHLAVRAHMRAAKIVKDYLTQHPKEADEPMVNALGTALQSATPQERKNGFFNQCASFYMTANQRLEAARPGYKRFGSQWLTAADADAKTAAVARQQKQLDSASDNLATMQDRFAAANKELEHQKFLITRGEPPTSYYVQRAQYNYDNAKSNLDAAQQKYDAVVNSLERPTFPDKVELVAMDSLTPPPVDTATAVASAQPMEIKPKIRQPRQRKPRETPATPATPATPTDAADTGPDTPIALEPPRSSRGKVRITQYAAAFPVAPELVLTSASVIDDGATLQLQSADGQGLSAELIRKDPATGLALLKVVGRRLHPLAIADAFAGGPVTCASFPTVDLFSPAAQSITGSATPPKQQGWTVALNLHPRLPGAPLIAGGKVVGVCIAPRDAERNKLPAVTLDQLKQFLGTDATSAEGAAGNATASLLQLVTTRESGE